MKCMKERLKGMSEKSYELLLELLTDSQKGLLNYLRNKLTEDELEEVIYSLTDMNEVVADMNEINLENLLENTESNAKIIELQGQRIKQLGEKIEKQSRLIYMAEATIHKMIKHYKLDVEVEPLKRYFIIDKFKGEK